MSHQYLELLYQAVNTPLGLVVETPDPQNLKARLVAARKASGDPNLSALTFKLSSSPTELRILTNAEKISHTD